MKRMVGVGMLLSAALFSSFLYAAEVRTGEVLEVDKQSVTIEDFDTGKPVKMRRDEKTKIHGNLQKGALVEFKEKAGRAISVKVIVEEEEMDADIEQKPESEMD